MEVKLKVRSHIPNATLAHAHKGNWCIYGI